MKVVRVPCSIGNRLVGLSFYNPLSRTSRSAKIISLKARVVQPTGLPKGILCAAPSPVGFSQQPWQLSLWLQLFPASPQREKGRTLNMIIRTAGSVVFVTIWLNGEACGRLGFGKKWSRVNRPHLDIQESTSVWWVHSRNLSNQSLFLHIVAGVALLNIGGPSIHALCELRNQNTTCQTCLKRATRSRSNYLWCSLQFISIPVII